VEKPTIKITGKAKISESKTIISPEKNIISKTKGKMYIKIIIGIVAIHPQTNLLFHMPISFSSGVSP